MKKRYIFFVIIGIFSLPGILTGLLKGNFFGSISFVVLCYTLYFVNKVEKNFKGNDGLTQNDKIQVILTEIFNPVVFICVIAIPVELKSALVANCTLYTVPSALPFLFHLAVTPTDVTSLSA